MIIHDLNIVCITLRPGKADPPLIIDTNTVLSPPITLQCLEPISRWDPQITERKGALENQQLPSSNSFYGTEPQDVLVEEQPFRFFRAKGTDHREAVYSASRHRSSDTNCAVRQLHGPTARRLWENGAQDAQKSLSRKAAGEWKPEAYPQGCVEDFDELRKKLTDIFSSRLGTGFEPENSQNN